MNNEITVVTAFYNIGRGDAKSFKRTNDQYFQYFRVWAHLKNKMVIYVESEEMKEKVLNFRDSIGLLDRTIVNVVDIYSIEPELYASMQSIAENKYYLTYRLLPNNLESYSAKYCYVTDMKMWFVHDAVEKGYAEGIVSWVDFGKYHGGGELTDSSHFDFLWKYDFSDKIHLFFIQKDDGKPIFDISFSMDTYVMGMIMAGPDYLWNKYWQFAKESMCSLCDCGIIDDDQTIELMAYRKCPEMFEIHYSNWGLPMIESGCDKYIQLKALPQDDILKKLTKGVYHFLTKVKLCFALSYRIFKQMYGVDIK